MKLVPMTVLLVACGSVDEKGPIAPIQLSTAFVAVGVASVCNANDAAVEDQTGAEIGNNCEPDFRSFPEPFGAPGVLGCIVADFGEGVTYGEVQVIAYTWDEERCGLDCDDGTDRENARLDIVGADNVEGTNFDVYGSLVAGEGDMLNPAVSSPHRYVFVCQQGNPDGFSKAVDIDVVRVE